MKKYKVIATKQQLENIGICYDIKGLVGGLIRKYPTGWYSIEVTYTNKAGIFKNVFDIPKTFLKNVE